MTEHGTSGVVQSDGVDYAVLDNAFAVGFDTSIDGGGTNRQAGRAGSHAMVAEYTRQRRALGYVEVRRDDLEMYFGYLDRADVAEAGGDPPLWPEPPVVAAKHRLDAALAPTPEDA